jgi:enoyl-CoA hydratase/carnithine racemase
MMASGRIISADEGLKFGILDRVAAKPFSGPEDLVDFATAFLDRCMTNLRRLLLLLYSLLLLLVFVLSRYAVFLLSERGTTTALYSS